jgi:hypothetical protein
MTDSEREQIDACIADLLKEKSNNRRVEPRIRQAAASVEVGGSEATPGCEGELVDVGSVRLDTRPIDRHWAGYRSGW